MPASRRKFLRDSIGLGAASAAALARPSSSAASTDRVAGANDRIRIGLIGCGGMGRSDLRDFLKIKNVDCVALCDVDDEQRAKTLKLVEAQAVGHSILVSRDFRCVIDQKDIDAVIVATSDHWHALPTIMACHSGQDVYVDEPLSLT